MFVFTAMLLLGAVIGFVGAGGAGVMITLLTVGFDVPIHTALGTSLAAMAFTTLSGSYSHFREGNVLRRLGLAMGLFGAVGAFCGALISSSLDTAVLTPLTAAALLLSALLLYLRIFHPHSPLFRQRFLTPRGGRFWLLAGLTGLINGLISGACGVGAASFIQLSLLLVFNAPLYQTVGTTMLIILPIAVLGGAGFLSAGHLEPLLFVQVLLGQTIGAFFGAKLTRLAPQILLKIAMVALPAFGGFILFLARWEP